MELKSLFFLIILQLSLISIHSEWCPELVPVVKTKRVTHYFSTTVTYRSFWGAIREKQVPNTYNTIESYMVFETRSVCCSGYKEVSGVCEPICERGCSEHSICNQPNHCICDIGYDNVDGSCKPHCHDHCPEHAYCISPDTCGCPEGFSFSDNYCQPICEPNCGQHSACQAPNVCNCESGYALDALSYQCLPVCSTGCPAYSKCFSPQRCECDKGYMMNVESTQCEPICSITCPMHSVCLRPGQCVCDEGYQMRDMQGFHLYCEPICEQNCSKNGKCVAPNVCECYTGYVMHNTAAAGGNHLMCEPNCSKGCDHGFCFSPELCVCQPGYLMGPNNTCAPTCSLGCINGACIEPEICACADGYRLAKNSVHVCEPVCEPSCVYADCVAPNLCICWNNYQPNGSDDETSGTHTMQHICVPTCSTQCIHGFCSAPNTCSCYDGYELYTPGTANCSPICNGCQYGNCIAPDVCHCWEGYEYKSNAENERCVRKTTTSTTKNTPTEVTTAADYRQTKGNALLPDATTIDVCTDQCRCWQEVADDIVAGDELKCSMVCVDIFDEACLNLSFCYCDGTLLELICNDTKDSREDLKRLYVCMMYAYTEAIPPSLHMHVQESAVCGIFCMAIIIIASIIGGVLICGVIYLIWQRYSNSRDAGDFVVNYQN